MQRMKLELITARPWMPAPLKARVTKWNTAAEQMNDRMAALQAEIAAAKDAAIDEFDLGQADEHRRAFTTLGREMIEHAREGTTLIDDSLTPALREALTEAKGKAAEARAAAEDALSEAGFPRPGDLEGIERDLVTRVIEMHATVRAAVKANEAAQGEVYLTRSRRMNDHLIRHIEEKIAAIKSSLTKQLA